MNNCAWLGIIYREFFRFKLPFSDRFRDILSEFIRFQYSRFTGCNQFMTFPRFSTLTGKKNHTHENDGEFFWSLPTIFTLKCMRWSSSTTYASSHQDKEDMTRWLSIYLSIYVPPYVLLVGSGAFNLISLIVKKECWLKSWNCVLASRPVRQGQWRWRRRWWENWRRSQFNTGHVTGDPWMRFPDLALPLAGRPGHGQLRYGAFIHFVLSASAVRWCRDKSTLNIIDR